MIGAAFDLGSNSLKLLAGERQPDQTIKVLHQEETVTRISQGIEENQGLLSERAKERTLAAFAQQLKVARNLGAKQIYAVATAGLRDARDGQSFCNTVKDSFSIVLEIISGKQEAELSFFGPSHYFGPEEVAVFDIGGRSTELMWGLPGKLQAVESLPMGTVSLYERYLANEQQPEALVTEVRRQLQKAPLIPGQAQVVGLAGTILSYLGLQLGVTHLAEAAQVAHQHSLQLASVQAQTQRLSGLSPQQRQIGTLIPKGRADVVVAGGLLTQEIMRFLGRSQIRVSDLGLNYGLLQSRLC